jgi:hypothetical protein
LSDAKFTFLSIESFYFPLREKKHGQANVFYLQNRQQCFLNFAHTVINNICRKLHVNNKMEAVGKGK